MPTLQRAFSPFGTFVRLEPGGTVERIKVDKAFWVGLRDRRIDGHLVGAVRMSRNFSWERHPDGDELLYVLSGAIDVVQEHGDEQHTVEVGAGKACVVPRGIWHRVVVREPGKLLFFTPGPRTEHRAGRQPSVQGVRNGSRSEAVSSRDRPRPHSPKQPR